MLYKTRAIVLNSLKYGDSGLIVRAYTSEFGRESLLAQGVRKRKSKLNPYLFNPFSIIDTELYYKQGRNLQRVKEATCAVVLNQLHFDIKRITMASFLAEVLLHALGESEANTPLFKYLFHAIQVLDVAEEGIENFHLVFMMQLTKFLGIHPANNDTINRYLSRSQMELYHLMDLSLSDIATFKISATNRSKLLDQLIHYYQSHLHGFGSIKSLAVLREVFS